MRCCSARWRRSGCFGPRGTARAARRSRCSPERSGRVERGGTGDPHIVDVTSDGRRPATLGRGDGFGEIALLRDVRRTASVTATTDALLLAVKRDAFVTAVTGHAETMQRAGSIIAKRLAAHAT
jgi:CRP-like cAMP-binding protein